MAQPISIYVSEHGLDALKGKLEQAQEQLKSIRAEKAVAYTATGDTWHDNPYFNKLEQDERAKEAEVSELSEQIASAQIYSVEKRNVIRVALGSIIHLRRYFKISGEEGHVVWEVSGFGEIDVPKQRVAYNAPLMQLLMGLHVGDTADTGSRQGPVQYEVVDFFASWEDVPAGLKKP